MKSRPYRKSSNQLARSNWLVVAPLLALLSLGRLGFQEGAGPGVFSRAEAQESLPPIGILLYLVDSTGDGDLVGPSTSCDDGTGHCTLRAAIEASNLHSGFEAISFNIPTTDPGYSNGTWTINLPRALPDISGAVSITGPGADKLVVQRSTAGGTPRFRVFNVTTSGTVSFSGITVANGSVFSETDYLGGGIQNFNAGIVNLTNCTLRTNEATRWFDQFGNVGPFAPGGGIANRAGGTINITSSTIDDNAADFGGGIYNSTSGTIDITNSTISNNSCPGGNGGGIYNIGKITITNSALVHNNGENGGGIYNFAGSVKVASSTIGPQNVANLNGGGIYNDDSGTLTVTNSTVSYNQTPDGSTSGDGGGIYNKATLSVANSTIAQNSIEGVNQPALGGGIYNDSAGSATIKSTIIAGNSGFFAADVDVHGSFTSQGFNLIGRTDGSTGFNLPTDLAGSGLSPVDPKFELDSNNQPLLTDNGGPTQTLALLCDSPAIDQGTSNGLTGMLTTDQRGSGFPRTFDDPAVSNAADGADIGAFELQQSCGGPTCNDVIFSENFDSVTAPALPAGWTATNPDVPFPNWATSSIMPDSGPNDAFVSDPAKESDARLDSPVIAVQASSAKLTFRNNYDLYQNQTLHSWDGGALEISINGGAFMDIVDAGGSFVTGGYNAIISQLCDNPLGCDRSAWTGNSNGYVTTILNLPPSAAGQNIQLRWRLGSVTNSPGASGWSIDTVRLLGCTATHAVSGHVRYFGSGSPVAAVEVDLSGGTSQVASTDATGAFAFAGLGDTDWTLTPQSQSAVGSAISTLDAVFALQAVIGARQLNAQQTVACDTSGNGSVTTLDAVYILQYVVGLIQDFPATQPCGSLWAFVPAPASTVMNEQLVNPAILQGTCQHGAMVFPQLMSDANNQDFAAVVVGDCNGNWQPTTGAAVLAEVPSAAQVRFAPHYGGRGGRVRFPLLVDSAEPFHGLNGRISYDSAGLQLVAVRRMHAAGNALVQYKASVTGEVRLALASAEPIVSSSGPVVALDFERRSSGRLAPPHVLSASVAGRSAAVTSVD